MDRWKRSRRNTCNYRRSTRGKYLIEIEKIAPEDTFYKKHSFNIELSKNTSARIDVEIAPEDLLHGTILYYTPMRTLSKKGILTVTTNSEESKVYIDNSLSIDQT